MRIRRTAYTQAGHKIRVNFHGDLYPRLTSYRIEGGPLVRATDFTCEPDIYDALRRVLSADPRPRGLPRV